MEDNNDTKKMPNTPEEKEKLRKERKAIADKKYRESEKGRVSVAKRKEYYDDYNKKEETKEKKHQWYLENKDKLNEKNKEKFTCSCGRVISFGQKSRHQKTKYHIEYCK